MADVRNAPTWGCKIGIRGAATLPPGADLPMRSAIARAFRETLGVEPEFIFSGWGKELTESEKRVVDERGPGIDGAHFSGFNRGGDA